jgi:hypothetical protein
MFVAVVFERVRALSSPAAPKSGCGCSAVVDVVMLLSRLQRSRTPYSRHELTLLAGAAERAGCRGQRSQGDARAREMLRFC